MMASITGPGAGNFKMLKQMEDLLKRLVESDNATEETQEKVLEAIEEITKR